MTIRKMFSFIGKAGRLILPIGRLPDREKSRKKKRACFSEREKRRGAIAKREQNRAIVKKQVSLSTFLPVASRGMSSSTVANYQTAVRSFIRFGGGRDMPLSGINCRLVACYERWLHENGVCPNTSSCYLRSLRAIYNKAVARRQVKDKNPFRNTFTGNDRTIKRSIGALDLRKLQALELPAGSSQALVRDLFLFSFCAMGMPFADMARLQKRQVRDGVLTYCRRKTGRQVRVKIEGIMQNILDRYACKDTDYLFPILYRGGGKHLRPRRYSTALHNYNRTLQTLAMKSGIETHLSSYTPRHSWASMAYRHNVSLPVISQALGHSNTHTTLIYIRGIDDRQVAKANKKLLLEILAPPLGKRCGNGRKSSW